LSERGYKGLAPLDLLTRKGIYPYSYMNSWKRFEETQLPSKEAFYNDLDDSPISDEDYNRATQVWNTFGIQNMGQYHDLYLRTDVLLLADVFENFRDIALEYYKLDPCHYFTATGMSWDALLKMSGIELDLLTNVDDYQFFESAVRGGICQISKRHSIANNKYLSG